MQNNGKNAWKILIQNPGNSFWLLSATKSLAG
jgi:hypothetical protein